MAINISTISMDVVVSLVWIVDFGFGGCEKTFHFPFRENKRKNLIPTTPYPIEITTIWYYPKLHPSVMMCPYAKF